MKTKIITLKNDVKLIYTYVKEVKGFDLNFIFQAGALNDFENKNGIAHFSEHVLASALSTKNWTRQERRTEKNKYLRSNAGTNLYEMRIYYQDSEEEIENILNLLTDPFENLIYNKDEAESERQIILDEVATRIKTNNYELTQTIYKNISIDRVCNRISEGLVGGTEETIKNISVDDIKRYIETYCTQNNLTIVFSGHVKKSKLIKLLNKYLKRIKGNGAKGYSFEDYKGYKKPCYINQLAVEDNKSLMHVMYLYSKREKCTNLRNYYIKNLLQCCLSEKLFDYYRTKRNYCYNAYAILSDPNYYNSCEFFVVCNNDVIDKVVYEFNDFLKFYIETIDEELFLKHKKRLLKLTNYDYATLSQISSTNYFNYEMFNKMITDNEIIKTIKSISYQDIINLSKEVFRVQPYLIVLNNDNKLKDFDYKNFCKEIKNTHKIVFNQ